MKFLETLTHNDKTLAVIVETQSETGEDKAYVSYFINGREVTDWGRLSKLYQELLTSLADNLCCENELKKWSY